MRLPVRGLWLNALERGSGETSLLLHGWLDHAHSFDRLAPLLPGRTVALDFRGHGDSDWAPAAAFYHFVEYIADLDAVLEQTGATRIVGHSMGASVALLYAAARPGRLRHVTLLDSAPLVISAGEVPLRLSAWLDDLKKPRQRRPVESVEDAARRLMRFQNGLPAEAAQILAAHGVSPEGEAGIWRGQSDREAPAPESAAPAAAQSARPALAWKWDPWLRAHSPLPFTEEALQALLAEVATPVLLVRAQNGMTPDEAELRARLAKVASLRIETIPGTGHHLHLEAPEEIARLIAAAWA
jgi:pimeloyl-ACP methyl ester carboxylesterase